MSISGRWPRPQAGHFRAAPLRSPWPACWLRATARGRHRRRRCATRRSAAAPSAAILRRWRGSQPVVAVISQACRPPARGRR